MEKETAIIIGAGPAGLTAAFELLKKTKIKPVVLEKSDDIGGISKTIEYKGNRIDLGGHRFFSKSDRVMKWWLKIFPLQGWPALDDKILDRDLKISKAPDAPDPEKESKVMLLRNRLSRILFLRRFFNYPIDLSLDTLKKLGSKRILKIFFSYLRIRIFPIRKERSLEDFFINRFGVELYNTFFKDYTEKVWGVPCKQIKPEWGAQRVKGLSISSAISHAVKNIFKKDISIEQKKTETSLIEQFMYPKYGPGQLWEEVAKRIKEMGGEIILNTEVSGIELCGEKVKKVMTDDGKENFEGRYFFSTMPVKDLVASMDKVPDDIRDIAKGLKYRDFITVGLLLKNMKVSNKTKIASLNNIIPDNWIYVQENDVKLGRIQVFNNWSPYMVKDIKNVWLGLEYFCDEGDGLWSKDDPELSKFAIMELIKIGLIDETDVIDSVVVRMQKTYPAYFGSYEHFSKIRDFADKITNLFLIGRNGMHRYNNQDHSMLTAITAVENIVNGVKDKNNIWEINTEKDYHETK